MPETGIKRPVIFWSLFGGARDVKGLEEARIIHIKGAGGTAVFRDSTSPRIRGRVFRRPRDENEAARYRKLDIVMMAREDDPSPLSLQAGAGRNWQGSRVTREERDRLKSNAVDFAIAEHKRKGALRDQITIMLSWGLLASILICGISWFALQVFRWLQ